MPLFRRKRDAVDKLVKANQDFDKKLFELEIVLKDKNSGKKVSKKIEIGFDFDVTD